MRIVALMANEKPTTTSVPRTTDKAAERSGVLLGIASLAIDTGDKAGSAAAGFAQDLRSELRTAADASIDAVESLVRGFFRIGKRATARVDEFAADLIGASERTASGVFRGLRDTTRAAGELASTAATAVIGERPAAQA